MKNPIKLLRRRHTADPLDAPAKERDEPVKVQSSRLKIQPRKKTGKDR